MVTKEMQDIIDDSVQEAKNNLQGMIILLCASK